MLEVGEKVPVEGADGVLAPQRIRLAADDVVLDVIGEGRQEPGYVAGELRREVTLEQRVRLFRRHERRMPRRERALEGG